MATRSCNSTTASRSAASPSSLVVRLEETGELLEQTCGEISDATTTELIEVANSVAAQRKMQDLLPVYFHSWQLQSPESIMVFLLLSYFVLKRECTGLKRDRQSFEDHIESLKTRVGELEQDLTTVSATAANKPVHSVGKLKELQDRNTKLQKAQDELYEINQQWALDYESLTRRIASNTTSCHSLSSSTGGNTSMCTHSQNLQQQLEESHRQICELTARNDTLEQERKRSDRTARILENENRAIQIQLQELGDLQMALKLKEEHIKLKYQFAQLKREHQDHISERLQLHKQLEKVRHAFLHIFPFVTTTSMSGRERSTTHGGGGYNTVPKLACRRQHYYMDPTPPTPPGLIARGVTHQGSLVEKDLKPRIHYDEQVTGFERSRDEPHTWPCATDTIPKKKTRPRSIFHLDQLKCPSCSKAFSFAREDFDTWFEHIQYCGV